MRSVYKPMIIEHLVIHAVALILLLGGVTYSRAFGVDYMNDMLGIYLFGCIGLLSCKPYCAKNWRWLQQFPIKRSSLLWLVMGEALIVIPAFMICFFIVKLLHGPSGGVPNSSPSVFKALSKLSEIKAIGYYLVAVIVCLSPFLLCVFQPVRPSDYFAFTPSNHGHGLIPLVVILILVWLGFTLAPVLTITILLGLVAGYFGYRSLRAIFPARAFKKWTSIYGTTVFFAAISILVIHSEVTTAPELRPLSRKQKLGILAPSINQSDFFTLIANPKISGRDRINVIDEERPTPDKNLFVSISDLREWSKKTKGTGIFLQGLRYFRHQNWTTETLIELETELEARCNGQLQKSRWSNIWRCNSSTPILEEYDKPLTIIIQIESLAQIIDVLTTEHPLLASMFLQTSLREGGDPAWRAKIQLLSDSKIPVTSSQAQMWLERLEKNPNGKWNCIKRGLNKDSVCTDSYAETMDSIEFESSLPGDAGGGMRMSTRENSW